MKGKRLNLPKRIIEIIRFLSESLSSGLDLIKRKFFHSKAKIETEEIPEKTEKKIKIDSELSRKIQLEEKSEEGKKKAKEKKLEEEAKKTEKTEESQKEMKSSKKEEVAEAKLSERKLKENEKAGGLKKEILERRKAEEELEEKEKEEEKTPSIASKKPYIKKAPTEEREKKARKPSTTKKKLPLKKKKESIDLGNVSKRKYRRIIQPTQEDKEKTEEREEEKSEDKEISIRIEAPFIDINLDELKISLVLPSQQFEVDSSEEVPRQINYKIEINGEGQKDIPVKVKSINQNIVKAQEKRVYLEKPLKSFEVIFPDELQGIKYNYNHRKKFLYAFVAIGNNRGRMCYLYDSDGNFIALPKKHVWIFLNEDFKLKTEEIIVEEDKWIWNTYRPFLVNFKKNNKLIVENRKSSDIEKLSCYKTFSIVGEQLIEDDFKEESPLFIGDSLKIKAPIENPSGWCVWIQSRGAGHKIVKENWCGIDELKLQLPDCLPCEYGEFQIDICPKDAGEADETLFFRWIDFIELKYPKSLIIPDPVHGSKVEHVKIYLNNIEDWDLKCRENLKINKVNNNVFKVEVHPEKDIVHLSLAKKGNPENEFRLQITIPRLKWRTSKQSWRDKPQKIKRENLNLEDNLIIRTNDWKNKYDLIATIEMNGKQLQEASFIRKGIEYLAELRQFYDTIKKNKEDLKIKAKIIKDSKLLGTIEVLNFLKEVPIPKKTLKQKIKAKRKTRKNSKLSKTLPLVKCKEKLRKGKGFSKEEIVEAGMNLDDCGLLNIYFDKRRKSSHKVNIETLKKLKRGN